MEQPEEKEHQKCRECGRKLAPVNEPNMSYVILNKEQFLMNPSESSLFHDLFTELRKGDDKEQVLYHAVQSGELLARNVCFDCFERVMNDLESSINTADQIRQDYADNLRSMEEEARARTFPIYHPE